MTRSNLDELVNRSVLRWNTEASALRRDRLDVGAQTPGTITISRDYGALGAALGEMVGERLGFHVYDRELVETIAESTHARTALVESIDERRQDALSRFIAGQFGAGHVTDSEYLRTLLEVVAALGHKRRCVIIGRGSQFILERATTLNVRVLAPFELRVSRIAEREHLDLTAARARVAEVDGERRYFTKHHFRRDSADELAYDLSVNTGSLSLAACTELVVLAFRSRFGGAG